MRIKLKRKYCKCGCGKFTKWNKQHKRYNTYINGHVWKNRKLLEAHRKNISLNHARMFNKDNPWFGKKHSEKTKLKISISNKGKKLSEEVKRKISFAVSGEKNPFYNKKHMKKTKRIISIANTGRNSGVNHYLYGKHLSETTKKLISLNHADMSGKNSPWFGKKHSVYSKNLISKAKIGKIHTEETKKKMSLSRMFNKNPNWQGGISFEPYGLGWTKTLKESVRQRDNYTCKLCGIKQKTNKKHDVHHIDYNKKNNDPDNLITLCNSCHAKITSNRNRWTKMFSKMIKNNIGVIALCG